MEIITRSAAETKKLGSLLARAIVQSSVLNKHAFVVSLEGELGSGKTTFAQGFAKGLGVKENPRSPTFVIMQIYSLKIKKFKNLIHVDAYRLKSKDFKVLNWKDFIKNKINIILVEWGNKIRNILPKNSLRIIFKHVGHEKKRLIKFINP